MATNLSQQIESRRGVTPVVGRQILDVITAGMYSDPRMALREYVQNAADAIDAAVATGDLSETAGRIAITVDGRTRTIVVEDNGMGVAAHEAESRLGSLGCSSKVGRGHRGFRGIGRLGGLSYCDLLRFETRSGARDLVTVIEWAGNALRDQVEVGRGQENIESAVRRIATVYTRKADKNAEPPHFFRVTMSSVHRFHSDPLMNVKGLRDYLAQTVPVPYDTTRFSFAETVDQHLRPLPGYHSYRVTLNGTPVVRPYSDIVALREGKEDRISDVELLELTAQDGRLICRGWYAKTKFLSAIPLHVPMRGVRVRQGNMGVGDEDFLKALYAETRFATWHIGELHVGDGLKLNARRDGFEASPDYERFLEWCTSLCRELSSHCRESSQERSAQLARTRAGSDLERLLDTPFFVDDDHKQATLLSVEESLKRLRRLNTSSEETLKDIESRITALRSKPADLSCHLDGRTLKKDPGQLLTEVCRRVRTALPEAESRDLLQQILAPYTK